MKKSSIALAMLLAICLIFPAAAQAKSQCAVPHAKYVKVVKQRDKLAKQVKLLKRQLASEKRARVSETNQVLAAVPGIRRVAGRWKFGEQIEGNWCSYTRADQFIAQYGMWEDYLQFLSDPQDELYPTPLDGVYAIVPTPGDAPVPDD